jgi:nucleoside-diphosphate-sugar epimerase
MASNYSQPINIGSDRMVTVNDLVQLISRIAGKPVDIVNIPGPVGVMGRTSDNTLIKQVLDWAPPDSLEAGLEKTYRWIQSQL